MTDIAKAREHLRAALDNWEGICRDGPYYAYTTPGRIEAALAALEPQDDPGDSCGCAQGCARHDELSVGASASMAGLPVSAGVPMASGDNGATPGPADAFPHGGFKKEAAE